MNELERRTLLGAAGIGALAAMSKAGPLNPPAGPVVPSGRTLDEVYNKIATPPAAGAPGSTGVLPDGRKLILGGNQPVTIDTPGSYVLAGPVGLSSAPAIVINAPQVTLDLNGHGVGYPIGSSPGISVHSGGTYARIRNGRVSGAKGIELLSVHACIVEDVTFEYCRGYGVHGVSSYSVVRRCTFLGIAGGAEGGATGVYLQGDLDSVHDCIIHGTAPFDDPQGLTTYGVRIVGNGSSIAGNRIVTLPAVVGTGVRMDGTGSYRDNTVQGYSVAYGIFGGSNGGGNFTIF